jgi:hypothetical protein
MPAKKHGPLFVDEDEPEASKPPSNQIEVKESTKELTTNILGFGLRFGKAWTREEDLCMLQLLEKGDTIDQIAMKLCRSIVSIACRIRSDFNCRYKTMEGNYTYITLGFDQADIKSKITEFGDIIINRVNEIKQLKNPTNTNVSIDPPVKSESRKTKSESLPKPVDEMLSLLREINRKLDLIVERTM